MIGGPLVERLAQKKLEQRFDHSMYGLKPKHGILAQHPMVNDELPNRLASGTLKLKPNIKHFTGNGVAFEDGTTENDIDVVMFATGYVFGFPFLDESVIKVVHNKVELYKYIFPPNLKRQTLCIIGCVQALGALMPVSEMQSRLATRVFKVIICKSNSGKYSKPFKYIYYESIMYYRQKMFQSVIVDRKLGCLLTH